MRPRHTSQVARLLYVEDLARRLHAMEQGLETLDAVAYRLYARRMRRALAGVSEAELRRGSHPHAAVQEARANLYFAEHGHFEGHAAIADASHALLARFCRTMRGA